MKKRNSTVEWPSTRVSFLLHLRSVACRVSLPTEGKAIDAIDTILRALCARFLPREDAAPSAPVTAPRLTDAQPDDACDGRHRCCNWNRVVDCIAEATDVECIRALLSSLRIVRNACVAAPATQTALGRMAALRSMARLSWAPSLLQEAGEGFERYVCRCRSLAACWPQLCTVSFTF